MVDCLKGFGWGNDSHQVVKQLKLWIGAQEFIVHIHFEPNNRVLDSDEEDSQPTEKIICQVLLRCTFSASKVARNERREKKFGSFCTWHINYILLKLRRGRVRTFYMTTSQKYPRQAAVLPNWFPGFNLGISAKFRAFKLCGGNQLLHTHSASEYLVSGSGGKKIPQSVTKITRASSIQRLLPLQMISKEPVSVAKFAEFLCFLPPTPYCRE